MSFYQSEVRVDMRRGTADRGADNGLLSYASPPSRERILASGGPIGQQLLMLFFLLSVSFAGGVLNRLRGAALGLPSGELSLLSNRDDHIAPAPANLGKSDGAESSPAAVLAQVVVHGILGRLVVFSLPLAGASMVAARRSDWSNNVYKRGLFGLVVALLTWTSLWVSWDQYDAVGRVSDCVALDRGVFDWLIGHCQRSWDDSAHFGRRWAHDICGLSWRGLGLFEDFSSWFSPFSFHPADHTFNPVFLFPDSTVGPVQTAPLGLVFFHAGFGWELAFSGAFMGFAYELGWRMNSDVDGLERGTNMGEVFWGAWVWFVSLLSILAYRSSPVNPIQGTTKRQQVVLHVVFGWLTLLFFVSSIWYGVEVHQKDMRDRDASLIGMVIAAVTLLLSQAVLVFRTWRYRRTMQAPLGDDRSSVGTTLFDIQDDTDGFRDGDNDTAYDQTSLAALSFPRRTLWNRVRDTLMPTSVFAGQTWPWIGVLLVLRPLILLVNVWLVVLTVCVVALR
jgi:hypothetical protein